MRHTGVVLVLEIAAVVAAAGVAVADAPGEALADARAQSSVGALQGGTVDSTRDVGTGMSVAVSPRTGAVVVSYYDNADGDLWVAAYAGSGGNCGPSGSWLCQLVDSVGDVGASSAIAITDSSINIAYFDNSQGELKFATAPCVGDGCTWVKSTVDQRMDYLDWVGIQPSMAWDSSGDVGYVTYKDLNAFLGFEYVRVASPRPAGDGNCGVGAAAGFWQCDTIIGGNVIGSYSTTVIDALHRPQIAFYDGAGGRPYHAVLVGSGGNCGPGGSWRCSSPDATGHDYGVSTSLWTEDDGTPHLAFIDATADPGQLVYATWVGSAGNCGYSNDSSQFEWWCEVVDSDIGPVGTDRTVAMTGHSGSGPMIAYRDASSELGPAVLMTAQPAWAAPPGSTPNCGPVGGPYEWVCTPLDMGGKWLNEAAGVALAEASDVHAVAYHELDSYPYPAEGNLKVLTDTPLLFADGLESASLGRWSSHLP